MKLEGQIIAEAGVPNKNNRVYPASVLEQVANEFSTTHRINKTMMGHLGMQQDSLIRFAYVSHMVEDLKFENGVLKADIEVLVNTPMGKVLKDLANDVSFRMAGMGDIKEENGQWIVQDDYKLVTINAVPSTEAA